MIVCECFKDGIASVEAIHRFLTSQEVVGRSIQAGGKQRDSLKGRHANGINKSLGEQTPHSPIHVAIPLRCSGMRDLHRDGRELGDWASPVNDLPHGQPIIFPILGVLKVNLRSIILD
jgi:hypothetical protein